MKKVLFMFLMVVMALAVVACNGVTTTEAPTTGAPTTAAPTTVAPTTQAPTTVAPTTQAPTTVAPTTEAPTTVEQDTIAPVINGVDDVTIYLNETFDPMAGVTATDNKDGDITSSITVAGVVDTTKEGTNFLVYTVYDAAGNKKQESRYVYVEIDPSLIGDEIVQNGDFSLGNAVWNVTDGEGSSSTFNVVDGVGVLEVVTPSWNPWAPRLESNVIEFETGVTYQITFDAKAAAVRSINVQVGELLSGAPWFDDYKPMQPQIFDLSTDWQTFTFKFTMNKDTGPGQLLFENGTVTGGVGTANLATTVYYDNVVIVESTPDEDTQAPVISGAKDVTLETGAVYDPLAGVSAYDVVDGEITLDSTHYVSNVNTEVPGEYEVTYTVSDVAGNITTITIYVTVVDLVFNPTTMVVNGDFEAAFGDPSEWLLYEANWEGGPGTDGTMSIDTGALKLEVVNIGTWGYQGWLLQASQNIDFALGETYRVSFKAKADAARDISALVGFQDGDNWHQYGGQAFSLTTEYQTYSYFFTVTEDSGALLEALKFEYGQAADTVYIDDVVVEILQQDALLTNGSFSELGWGTWSHDGASTIAVVNGELVVNVASVGGDSWAVQLFQNDLPLVQGSTYEITFSAKADAARDIIYKIMTPGYVVRTQQTVSLTTEYQTFTYSFVYDGTDPLGQINFELGNINGALAGTVYFDNVSMTKDAEPLTILNGNFEQVIGWGTWSHDEASTIAAVNGELVVNVASVGADSWAVQVFQNDIALVQGNLYTIVFDAKSDVARDIIYKIMTPGYNVRTQETVSLTTEYQTFKYSFVYDGTDPLGQINFELGNISGALAGTVYFDNVYFFRNMNPGDVPAAPLEEVWTAYGTMTLVETETEKTITYVAGDANPWDSNIQGVILPFDGTQTHIVFTFTGVENHTYLFKIEVNQDLGRQIEVVATGVQQEVILDLSTMTEAERNQLNKIIIFSWNTTQSGTLIFNGWDYYTI